MDGLVPGPSRLLTGTVGSRLIAVHAEVAGLRPRLRNDAAFRRQSELEQFAHRRCAAGHARPETEIVNEHKLFWREHDLETLVTLALRHVIAPQPAQLKTSQWRRVSQSLS